jgi:TonB-dependent receptor
LGGLFSVAYSQRQILEEGFSTVRWQDGTFRSVEGVNCVAVPADPGCVATNVDSSTYHPRIPRYGRLTHDQDRLGITGSLQFRPSADTEISLDGLYSNYESDRHEEYLEVFFRSQEPGIDVLDYTVNGANNTVDSGTFNIDPLSNGTHPVRSEHRYDELQTEFTQLTLDIDHSFTDRLYGNAMIGTSTSENDNPVQTTILADAIDVVNGYRYNFSGSGTRPTIDFGSLDVNDPTQFAFTEVRDRPQAVENGFDYFGANLNYTLTDAMTLRGGVSWKEFTFDSNEYRRESTFGSRVCDAGFYDCDIDNDGTRDINGAPISGDLLGYVDGFGSDLGMPGINDTSWISPNVQAAAALIDLYSVPGAPQAGNIRSVEEEDIGAWVQLDFSMELGSIPIRGDVGVRYVETTTTSTGLVDDATVTVQRDYDDTLPALNLVFDLHDDFLMRFSVAEVMARPSLGDLTPGGSLDSFTGPPFEYKAGNPGLDPYRATNFDLSFEWYFAEESLLSLALFTKDVDSFFFNTVDVIVPYSQSGLPIDLAPASSPLRVALDAGGDPNIAVSQKQNGGSASVDGFEIIYQQPFYFLPGIFSNFGFTGNFTNVDSDEILGFSENAWNATLWYEADRLSARVSAAYRDPYQTDAANPATGRDQRGYAETTNIDLAVSYQLTDTLELTFEAINLTDEYEHQVFDAGNLVNVYHHFGTEYIFGVRWAPY